MKFRVRYSVSIAFLLLLLSGCRKDPLIPDYAPFFLTYQGNTDLIGRDIHTGKSSAEIVVCGYGRGMNTDEDFFLIFLDSAGNETSRKFVGTSGNDQCWSFVKANDGGFIITGWTDINSPGVSNDVLIVKTDSEGNQQWAKTYGGNYNDLSTHIISTGSGYVVSAIKGGNADENSWILRLDNNGDTLWTFAYGGNQNDGAMSICINGDETYAITGYTNSTGNGSTDGYVMCVNDWGQMTMYRPFGTAGYEEPHDIEKTDNGWLVMGHAGTTPDMHTHNVFLQSITSTGEHNGFFTYGDHEHDGGEAMAYFSEEVYMIGRSSGRDPDQDAFFVRTDKNGIEKERRWIGTPNEDPAYGIYVDHYQVLITGYAVNPTTGFKDLLVIRK